MSSDTDPGKKAFERHMKQYVQAPVHRFAAIVPPELSALCADELSLLGYGDSEVTEAGVEFSGKLSACYGLNLWLRTASRVLCRLPSFRAGISEELFHKVASMRWELWLNPGIPIQVEGFVELSRIGHEGVVADTVARGIQRRFQGLGMSWPRTVEAAPENEPSGDAPVSERQRVLVRLIRNHCEISLDTTGAHLHQRGYRQRHMGAPLRETLASAILLRSGWKGDSPLVDGMCGSGTLGIEAVLMARNLAPGRGRRFLFEKWPSLQEKTWDFLRRKAEESALPRTPVPIFGLDIDSQAVETARENGERAGVGADVKWEARDFFSFRPKELGIRPGLVVLNPPYGKRIAGGGKVLYEKIGVHLREAFGGWRAAVLAPDRPAASALKLRSPRLWTITHGGLPVTVAMARL